MAIDQALAVNRYTARGLAHRKTGVCPCKHKVDKKRKINKQHMNANTRTKDKSYGGTETPLNVRRTHHAPYMLYTKDV